MNEQFPLPFLLEFSDTLICGQQKGAALDIWEERAFMGRVGKIAECLN